MSAASNATVAAVPYVPYSYGIPPVKFYPMVDFVIGELIVNVFVVFFTVLVVCLRIYARIRGAGIGADDICIMIACPLGVGMLICQGFLSPVGTGMNSDPIHGGDGTLMLNAPFIFFMSFVMEVIYVPCLALSKASMLLFYRRVFSTPSMHKAINIGLGLLLAWTIAFECACIFLCWPVSFFWVRATGNTEGMCGDFIPMIQSLIATNAVGDLCIMIMPVSIVWGLQMKKTEKLGIIASFAIGFACVIIAIFRVIYLAKVDLASNLLGTMATTVLLFTLEPNLAILSVSIPMLRPLYTSYRKRRNGSSRLYDDKLNSGSNGLRTIGGGGQSQIAPNAQRSKFSKHDPMEETVWEMENYRPKGNLQSRTVVVDSHGLGAHSEDLDDTSSEKSLTKVNAQHGYTQQPHRNPSNGLGGGIGVKTTWTVSHTS